MTRYLAGRLVEVERGEHEPMSVLRVGHQLLPFAAHLLGDGSHVLRAVVVGLDERLGPLLHLHGTRMRLLQ